MWHSWENCFDFDLNTKSVILAISKHIPSDEWLLMMNIFFDQIVTKLSNKESQQNKTLEINTSDLPYPTSVYRLHPATASIITGHALCKIEDSHNATQQWISNT